ncbi:MAG TPA: hypothetical protein HPP87_10555 [Planctomycetes bacterium]|nr:hypothetical protein [Planctomycetota bacterium]
MKIIAESKDGYLFEASVNEARNITGSQNPKIGDTVDLISIQKSYQWIQQNKGKLTALANSLTNFGENLSAAVKQAQIGGKP